MKKKSNKKQLSPAHDSTLYYRATYVTSSGDQEQEVFISDSMDRAREYAAGPNLLGRQLLQLEEFKELIDSLL
jgi:hypothetical protein